MAPDEPANRPPAAGASRTRDHLANERTFLAWVRTALGLIGLVVNALLFLLTEWIAGLFGLPIDIDGFWPAFWGAIVVGIVSWLASLFLPDGKDD